MRTSIKTLILSLVLGTSALASAAPCAPAPTPAPAHYIPVAPQPVYQQPAHYIPVAPAPVSVTKTLSGGEVLQGSVDIQVGRHAGEFRELELVAGWGNGSTTVKDVIVTFANGQTQTICVDQKLSHDNSVVKLDLAGNERFIKSVQITGSSRGRSAIELRGIS